MPVKKEEQNPLELPKSIPAAEKEEQNPLFEITPAENLQLPISDGEKEKTEETQRRRIHRSSSKILKIHEENSQPEQTSDDEKPKIEEKREAKKEIEEIHSLFVSQNPRQFTASQKKRRSGIIDLTGNWEDLPDSQYIARKVMTHPKFDMFVASSIVVNAIFLGVQTDHPDWPCWWYIEGAFCLLFSVELSVRIAALRCRFFRQAGCLFDASLILISLVDVVMSSISSLNNTLILRMLRLARIARILRLMKLYQSLYILIVSLQKSGVIVFWTMLLLIVTLFSFGIFTTRMVGQNEAFEGSEVQDHFHSVPRSMLSLFTVLTFEGWYWDFAQPIMNEMPFMAIFFILFLCGTSFSVLNVFTALIVESTMEKSQDLSNEVESYEYLSRMKHVAKLRQLFYEGDTNGDEELSCEEWMAMLDKEDVRQALQDVGVPVQEGVRLFALLDLDKSDALSIPEFIDGCLRLSGKVLMSRDITMSQYTLQRDLRIVQGDLVKVTKTNEDRWKAFNQRVEYLNGKIQSLTSMIKADQGHACSANQDQERLEHFCTLLEQAYGKAHQRKQMKVASKNGKAMLAASALRATSNESQVSNGDLAAGGPAAAYDALKPPMEVN